MNKLKNINFKALLVDHGEKIGLGFIVLTVLLALSSTSWSRYEKSPEDLKKKAEDARQRITSPTNVWPQMRADSFKVVDFNGKAEQLFTKMDLTRYEWEIPVFHPLYRKRELAREPEFRKIEFLIATSGRAILGVAPPAATPTGTEGAADGTGSALAESGTPAGRSTQGTGEFDIRRPGGAASADGTGLGAAGAHGTTPFATAIPGAAHAGQTAGRTPGGAHGMPMAPGMEGMMESGGAAGVTPRGVRFVAVRGVFPLRQQLEEYQRKLNVTSADANTMFELLDFVLERQAAIAGSDPWSGKWESVNIESALEVLRECSDFEADPVPTAVTDAVITMSLPFRLLGYWGDNATHPHIKDFQLKPEDREREEKLYAKLVEDYDRANLDTKPKYERKGLASAQRDLRQIGNQMMANQDAGEFMRGMSSFMNAEASSSGARPLAPPDIKTLLTASGRLLLFRYFDFDVQPGMAYRYRVKLVLRNPNFERPVEELADASSRDEATRETGWSNISSVAVVPTSTNYFLRDVERDPVRDDKPRSTKSVANLAMFEWDPKLGTMLADTLRISTFGQFIGESKKKTRVLDVSIPSFDEKEIDFFVDDVLVDATGDVDVAPDLHPDLGLKPEKGKKDAKTGVLPEALVVTSLGELKQLDPVSEKPMEEQLKRRVDDERKNFLHLKDAPKETTSTLEGSGAYQAMLGMAASAEGIPKPSSKKSSKKLSSGAAGAGGAHGGSGGGAHGGAPKSKTSSKKTSMP